MFGKERRGAPQNVVEIRQTSNITKTASEDKANYWYYADTGLPLLQFDQATTTLTPGNLIFAALASNLGGSRAADRLIAMFGKGHRGANV